MYEIIKNVINSKDYELRDMLYKINKMYIESNITEEQKTELDELARTNANAENSYAPLQEQIDNLYDELSQIKSQLNTLLEETEEGTEENPSEPPQTTDEYPEYVQPTGAHDCYNTGDKISFNGKKYVCKINGCVWDPDTYPAGWQEVIEEATDEDTAEPANDNSESEVGE